MGKRAGVKINLEPDFGHVGQIICPNGKIHYFRNLKLDLNPIGAAEISKDKDYANYFLSKMGYPIIRGRKFYSDNWAKSINSKDDIYAAWEYAKKIGGSIVVKPNSKSCGNGVFVVDNKADFLEAFNEASSEDDIVLVQKYISGNDYRILVLDNEVVSAYQRKPMEAVSDGKKTVDELFESRISELRSKKRYIELDFKDKRVQLALKKQELHKDSVLPKGIKLQFLYNSNLSTGGEAVDVTESINPFYADLSIKLTRDMGLRFCGVDIITEKDITKKSNYYIIEINASPGIDNYYYSGKKQKKIVEEIYFKLLKKMCE